MCWENCSDTILGDKLTFRLILLHTHLHVWAHIAYICLLLEKNDFKIEECQMPHMLHAPCQTAPSGIETAMRAAMALNTHKCVAKFVKSMTIIININNDRYISAVTNAYLNLRIHTHTYICIYIYKIGKHISKIEAIKFKIDDEQQKNEDIKIEWKHRFAKRHAFSKPLTLVVWNAIKNTNIALCSKWSFCIRRWRCHQMRISIPWWDAKYKYILYMYLYLYLDGMLQPVCGSF